jgi:hypothetical protein
LFEESKVEDRLKLAIRLDSKDNVATATDSVKKGETIVVLSEEGEEIAHLAVMTDVPFPFHKVALAQITKGGAVIKYGEIIGYASKPVDQGAWIHVHNIESANLPEKEIR